MGCFGKHKQNIQDYEQCASACHETSEKLRDKLQQGYSQTMVNFIQELLKSCTENCASDLECTQACVVKFREDLNILANSLKTS